MKKIRGLLCAMVFVVAAVGVMPAGWGGVTVLMYEPTPGGRLVPEACIDRVVSALELFSGSDNPTGGDGAYHLVTVITDESDTRTCTDFGF